MAATLTAAMLLREELKESGLKSSPRVVSKIGTAVQLAEMVEQYYRLAIDCSCRLSQLIRCTP